MSSSSRAWLALLLLEVAIQLWIAILGTPDGRVPELLQHAFLGLLGHDAFLIPLALTLAAVLLFAQAVWPTLALPRARLCGIGLIAVASLPGQHLLGLASQAHETSGALGAWSSSTLLDWLGGFATVTLLMAALAAGGALTFQLSPTHAWASLDRLVRRLRPVPVAPPQG